MALLLPAAFAALGWEANYDESRVGTFELPDPLICADGTPVATPQQWTQKRRGELLELFGREMYGVMPPKECARVKSELLSEKSVFGGRRSWRRTLRGTRR